MTITLSPGLRKFVEQKVRDGSYTSASAVVRDALELMKQTSDSDHIRREVLIGVAELDRGESAAWDVEEAKAEGRKLLRRSGPRNSSKRRKVR